MKYEIVQGSVAAEIMWNLMTKFCDQFLSRNNRKCVQIFVML